MAEIASVFRTKQCWKWKGWNLRLDGMSIVQGLQLVNDRDVTPAEEFYRCSALNSGIHLAELVFYQEFVNVVLLVTVYFPVREELSSLSCICHEGSSVAINFAPVLLVVGLDAAWIGADSIF
ncbi:hypothetical protein Nepgr_016472 [Nepenthes gracilis]|uniref:Uncharacterized protein n=1 Tax=Nepenthes gracilis TaxID=150966 RepID=A0AAD3SQL8_NEPGR|nr:hypothetical protein Nepgr_016472 [Nepenthes gracilis]